MEGLHPEGSWNREEQLRVLERETKMLAVTKHLRAKKPILTDTAFYFIMRYLPGGTLESILNLMKEGKIFFDKAKRYELTRRLFLALDQLHQANIIHLDIKPENIKVDLKLDEEGNVIEIGEVNIFDLNLSGWMNEEKYATAHSPTGTPLYMSPEAFDAKKTRKISYKADIYAMGLAVSQIWNADEPRISCKNDKDCAKEAKKQNFTNLCENIPDLPLYSQESDEITFLIKSLVQPKPDNIPEIPLILSIFDHAEAKGLQSIQESEPDALTKIANAYGDLIAARKNRDYKAWTEIKDKIVADIKITASAKEAHIDHDILNSYKILLNMHFRGEDKNRNFKGSWCCRLFQHGETKSWRAVKGQYESLRKKM